MSPTVTGAVIHFTNGMAGLQLRDQLPDIAAPGLVSTFGGQTEPGEDPYDALVRELREELNINLADYHHESVWSGIYLNWRGIPTDFELYVVSGVPLDAVRVEEGFLCVVDPAKSLATLNIFEGIREQVVLAMQWINQAEDRRKSQNASPHTQQSVIQVPANY